MARRKRGSIFVMSAPSGGGKTTLSKRLKKACPNLAFSVSLTTRKPRLGEKDGRDYRFVTKEKFLECRRAGRLLEWAKVFGNYYGTPSDFVENAKADGRDVMLAIDVKGALKVKKKIPGAVLIFILPPSLAELKRRLGGRKTEHARQIRLRLKIAGRELAQAKRYDYSVVNDKIGRAVAELKAIIAKRSLFNTNKLDTSQKGY